MNVHGHIFFENVFQNHVDSGCNFIKASQSRLRLRQCINDQREVQEALQTYKTHIEKIILYVEKHSQQPLHYQPYFSWNVGDKIHKSTCWYFESLMVKTCLAQEHEKVALEHIRENQFKEANTHIKKAMEAHKGVLEHELVQWSWKEPGQQFYCVLPQWHRSRVAVLEARSQFCVYQKAMDEDKINPKTMAKYANKIERTCVEGLCHWMTSDVAPECQMARAMVVLHHAEKLYAEEKRGTAIALAEKWLPSLHYVKCEWTPRCEKRIQDFQGTLLQWAQDNNAVYFDAVDEELLKNIQRTITTPELCEQPQSHHTEES